MKSKQCRRRERLTKINVEARMRHQDNSQLCSCRPRWEVNYLLCFCCRSRLPVFCKMSKSAPAPSFQQQPWSAKRLKNVPRRPHSARRPLRSSPLHFKLLSEIRAAARGKEGRGKTPAVLHASPAKTASTRPREKGQIPSLRPRCRLVCDSHE